MKSSVSHTVLLCIAWFCAATFSQAQNSTDSILQQHYDAAQKFQSLGDLNSAAQQYRIFIADALGQLAISRAHLLEYEKAAVLFDEALRLAPNSPALQIEYARAALAYGDLSHASNLAAQVIRSYPSNAKASAKAHLLLGRVLSKQNKSKEAHGEFEAAVALEPDFENGYALAIACLNQENKSCAVKVFSEMQDAFGDTALLHLEFGLAYGNSDFQQEAVDELRKAIMLDPHISGAHYALAALYVARSASVVPQAEDELRKELEVSPNDSLSYAALGHLEQGQNKYADAERDLKHAIELNDNNPDACFYLGQVLSNTGKPVEAEAALRRSIALTKDVSHNRYQIRQAHYLLGRILLASGRVPEGQKEMAIVRTMTVQNLVQDRDNLADAFGLQSTERPDIAEGRPEHNQNIAAANKSASELDVVEKRLAPVLADSYNNLGAIAAGDEDYTTALTSFHRAVEWDPSLEGLDKNWGRAAFFAHQFQEALPPLTRVLRAHSDDVGVRSMLGMSEYLTADYAGSLKILQPIEAQATTVPQLAFVYASAMVKAGDFDEGLSRLVALEKVAPEIPEVHRELAAAYQHVSRSADASREAMQYESLVVGRRGEPEPP